MNTIKGYWTKVANPASFVGATKLHSVLVKKGHKITRNKVTNYLKNQLTYQLHKPTRKRFPRRAIVVSGPNIMWDVDLLDLKEFRNKNFKNRYILTAIDVFSRKAYGQAMTNKSAMTAAKAFEQIIGENVPQSVRTDHGNEFKREFNALLKTKSIKHILTSSPEIKANYVERFHRTFRDKLMRYMTYYSDENWLRVYKSIIESYNNTPHTSLNNIAPNEVNSKNVGELLAFMLKKVKSPLKEHIFQVGQLVRIVSLKSSFAKASKHTHTDELFRIVEASQGYPKTYKIEDMTGETIIGSFYGKELQLAEKDAVDHKRVGKAINTGKDRYKVHFKNWPQKFDTILSKKELKFYERPK